jgi:hypothetical protein
VFISPADRRVGVLCAALVLAASSGSGQQVAPPIDFSGVIYPQFRYATDAAAKAANGGNAANKFDIERVYLTFRMPAGDDGSIRVTADVFNNAAACTSCYAGWGVRMKYAYFNYNFLHNIAGKAGFNASARIGMLHTAIIDQVESHWPRWVSQSAAERAGFFSSADVGAAAIVTFPAAWGEVYATVANGPGYTTAENDPYKDWSARVSLTPFAKRKDAWKSLVISPWAYAGKTASKFIGMAGASGTDAAEGLERDRAGVFVALKDRRVTAGLDLGSRTETVESGTTLANRGTTLNTGKLTSAFALVRPIELARGGSARSRLVLLGRIDRVRPFSSGSVAGAQTTGAQTQLMIVGASWDLNQRTSFSLDLQHLKPSGGSTATESRIFFLHGQVGF